MSDLKQTTNDANPWSDLLKMVKSLNDDDDDDDASKIVHESIQGMVDTNELRIAAEEDPKTYLSVLRHVVNIQGVEDDDVNTILSIATSSSILIKEKSNGWLPIHFACVVVDDGTSSILLKNLVEMYPESMTMAVDRTEKMPLHIFLQNNKMESGKETLEIVTLLSSSGAAGYADSNGMFPFHYACAFGAPVEILQVLVDAYPEAISKKDSSGRTPLDFALVNAGRERAPAVVDFLLSKDKSLVRKDHSLNVLAEYVSAMGADSNNKNLQQRLSCRICLEHVARVLADPTNEELELIESFPAWLKEPALPFPSSK